MQNAAAQPASYAAAHEELPAHEEPAAFASSDASAEDDDKLSVELRIRDARTTNFGADPGAAARLCRRSGSQLLLPCPHCGRATPKSRKDCVHCGVAIVVARPEVEYDSYNQDRSDVQLANVDEWRQRMGEASQRLVELIVGRTVVGSDYDGKQFVSAFDDGSHLIVETTGAANQLAPLSKVVALQQGFDADAPVLHLDFENSQSLDLPLGGWFSSVMVVSRENATLYAD